MSTIPREVHDGRAVAPRYDDIEPVYEPIPEKGTGWLSFAAIMLGLAGLFGLIDGIIAVSKSSFYVANAHYVFSDLNTWGWIVLILGVGQIVAAMVLLSGSEIARWLGIAVAGINALGQLPFVPAYPVWGLLMFSVDVLVIYGLAAYAGKRLRV
jgi:hypothetical protein